MAKLIGILAASLGGGLLLGAGIRLGERLAGDERGEGTDAATGLLAERLGQLEGRLSTLEAIEVPPMESRIDLESLESRLEAQAGEVSAVRVRLDAGANQIETLGQTDDRLRTELRSWLDQRVDERLRGVETKLRAESDEAQREMLNAVIESVQTRVILRISKLEQEVAGQAEGMLELRECTVRTEQSMQKLLGGIDRLIAAQPTRGMRSAESEPANGRRDSAAEPPEPRMPVAFGPAVNSDVPPNAPRTPPLAADLPSLSPPRRRWSIFG